MTEYKVVCDETNNTPESLAQGLLYADIYLKIEPTYTIKFHVDKDGKVTFE